MTPPMTPREKVAVFDPCPGCGADEPRNRCLGCRHDFAPNNRQEILDGSPVTALASGSGDHAELASLADEMVGLIAPSQGERLLEYERHQFDVASRIQTLSSTLLAENAALRAAGEVIAQKAENAIQQGFSHIARATEAERKLAEAVGDERARGRVIIDERDKWIVELISERDEARAILQDAVSEAVPDAMIFAGHPDAQRYSKALGSLREWADRVRTFLSKETERG